MATKSKTSTTGVPRFQQILASTGKDVLDLRAEIIFNGTNSSMESHLRNLYSQRDNLRLQKLNLTDLSVETTHSLRPGSKDYNPDAWVSQMVNLTKQELLLNDDIEVAEQVQAEYFKAPAANETAE